MHTRQLGLRGQTIRPFFAHPSVPDMSTYLQPEMRLPHRVTKSVAKAQGENREVKLKEGGGKDTTVRTETGSEAGCGR